MTYSSAPFNSEKRVWRKLKKINIIIFAKILILNLMIIWRLDVVGEDFYMQLKSICQCYWYNYIKGSA